MVDKICKLRIFEDENGKTNLSLAEVGGGLLVVSQFTLYADCRKGNRPSFTKAGSPQQAEELYEYFLGRCRERGFVVEHGVFGAHMEIELVNDGPFTLALDSVELFGLYCLRAGLISPTLRIQWINKIWRKYIMEKEKSRGQKLQEELTWKFPNIAKDAPEQIEEAKAFCEGYKAVSYTHLIRRITRNHR